MSRPVLPLSLAILAVAWFAFGSPGFPGSSTAPDSDSSQPFRLVDGRLTASNATGMQIQVDGDGLRVSHPIAGGACLRLSGIDGRELPAGLPASDHPVVAHRWQGPVYTWTWNRDDGVVTGFRVMPEARQAGSERLELALDLAVDGELQPSLIAGGEGLAWRDGPLDLRYTYAEPDATDAAGKALPSRFVLRDGRPMISVDTRGARWPINFEPVLRAHEPMLGKYEEGVTPPLQSFMSRISIYLADLELTMSEVDPTDGIALASFGWWNGNTDHVGAISAALAAGDIPAFLDATWAMQDAIAAVDAQLASLGYSAKFRQYPDDQQERFLSGTVHLPKGSDNKFTPGPIDQGQPEDFPAGRSNVVRAYVGFQIRVDSGPLARPPNSHLVWSANRKTTTFGMPATLDGQLEPYFSGIGEPSSEEPEEEEVEGGAVNKDNKKIVENRTEPIPDFFLESTQPKIGFGNNPAPLKLGGVSDDVTISSTYPAFTWNRVTTEQTADTGDAPGWIVGQPTKFPPGNHPELLRLPISADDHRMVWALNGCSAEIDLDAARLEAAQ